jgi:hypothetical protein
MRCLNQFVRQTAAVLLVVVLSVSAHADLVVNVPDVTIFSDGVNPISGGFEVFLTLTEGEAATPPMILTYNFSIAATDDTGLTFADPQPAMTMPLFEPPNMPDFDMDSNVISNEPHAAGVSITSVVAMPNAGLAKFPFTIAAGTPVSTQYTLELVGVREFGDDMMLAYPNVDFSDTGMITVAAVPEAGALLAMGAAALMSLVAASISKRCANCRRSDSSDG